MIQYDEQLFPDDRKDFIRNWIMQEETVSIAFLDKDEMQNSSTKIRGKQLIIW